MVLLILFAFLAGAGTAVSPCVLPVLPALLSAGATGGRRRPVGIVLGLAVTFTVTIVGLAKVVDGVGLGDSVTRDLAIVALAVFGVVVAVPWLGDRLEAPLSRLARFGPKSGGRGFWSGLLVGAALGFVYAPCAGPILAAVVSVSAASGRTVAVGLAYALGSSVVLLILALAGRRATVRLRGPALSRVLGAVMIVTAVAMAFQLDVRFQTAIADHLPAAVVNPTGSLEKSKTVSDKLASLRPTSRYHAAAASSDLDDYGPAPDFAGNDRWFNSKPLTLASLRGRVVLIDFWTYTCINCIRTFPHLKAWDAKYRSKGLTIVGVHSPEFGFEKKASNVERAIRQNGIQYPVAQDNELATWNAWSNQYWPAEYLIDARGNVRYANFGEGDTDKTEAAIRGLLADAGAKDLGGNAKPDREYDPSAEATPETYIGAARAERFLPGVQQVGTATYTPYDGSLPESHFTLGGRWKVTDESATAGPGATLRGNVTGKDVYLVLSGPGDVDVRVDGKHEQTVHVTTQKLYHLLSRPSASSHDLQLTFAPGVSAFAFTFG
ncbi:cytochrome c biogenesis protein DipZ [Solirubrobacter soli]|uniref:cytochrome c biogenesis protein DipZ n=1 Tax=Solirubrobacter soli TaxID=363832 RepID=UPI0004179F36|nr:cytochrome c biogenesis protein DipZ [Solirubrobacter soli]